MFLYYPVVLMCITTLMLFLPLKIFYHHSRAWWAFSNVWCFLLETESGRYDSLLLLVASSSCWSLSSRVSRFFLGRYVLFSNICNGSKSLLEHSSRRKAYIGSPFQNIALFFCLYADGWNNPPVCNSSHSRLLGFFTTLPSIWRGFQCLRRYRDTRNVFPHLVNLGKYTCGVLYYMALSLYRIRLDINHQIVFVVFAFINATYCSIWDIAMDWSLGNFYAPHKMLREVLTFRKAWFYYLAIVVDVIVRFNWIFYAIFTHDIQHSAFLSFAVSFSEVIRRGIWSIFRVENEHCTNVNMFRALRDIPLPYEVEENTIAEGIAANVSPVRTNETEEQREEEEIRAGEHPTEPSPYPPAAVASDVDLETAAVTGKTPLTLRARHPSISRTMSRIGTLVATAHSHDFQRRRRVDPLSGETETTGLQYMDDNTTDDDDDDDDDDDADPRNQILRNNASDVDLPGQTTNIDSSHGRND